MRAARFGAAAALTAALLITANANGDVGAGDADPLVPQPLAERTEIVVAIPAPLETFADLFLADRLGEFDRENLDVRIDYVPVQEELVLLQQGEIDVSQSAITAGIFNLMADGLNLRFVFPHAYVGDPESGQGFWYNTESFGGDGIQPGELNGRRVLAPSGAASISSWYLFSFLNKIDPDLALDDLSFEVAAPSDSPLALMSGAAPIGFVNTVWVEELRESGCCEYFAGSYPDVSVSGWVFGPSLLENDPAVGRAFVRALGRTVRDHLQGDYHADDVIAEALSGALDIQPEVLRDQVLLTFDPTFTFGLEALDVQPFFDELELLSYEPPYLTADQVFDARFVDDVLG